MPIDNYLTAGRRPVPYPLMLKGGFGSAALAADLQLTGNSSHWLRIDPNSASRNVDLPGGSERLTDSDGMWFLITNTADAAEDLTVRNPAGATIVVISQNEQCLVVGTGGEDWDHMGIVTIALS